MEKSISSEATNDGNANGGGRIQQLLHEAERGRETVLSSRFFVELRLGTLHRRRWLWQLLHWSGMFTRALSTRSGLGREDRFSDVFAEHASEEARHPGQLKSLMRKSGFGPVEEGWTLDHPATRQTEKLAGVVKRVAAMGSSLEQVMVLNALGEGCALDFYQAVLTHFGPRELRGPYFHVHAEVDDRHRLLGVDLLAEPVQWEYQACRGTLRGAAESFKAMLDSWATYELDLPKEEAGWSPPSSETR